MNRAFALIAAAMFMTSCGGSSAPTGPSPTPTATTPAPTTPAPAPTPTAKSVAVTLQSGLMYIGYVQIAKAVVDPDSLASSGAWASANISVVTVDSAGNVRSVGSGTTDVSYTVGSVRGSASVRVVPEYAGLWRGSYSITSCTDSGVFTQIDFCKKYNRVGEDAGMRASWTQSGTDVIGRIGISPGWPDSEANTGRIESNGRMLFGATITLGQFTIRAEWDVNSTTRGVITPASAMYETWRAPGYAGEGRITASLREMTRQ